MVLQGLDALSLAEMTDSLQVSRARTRIRSQPLRKEKRWEWLEIGLAESRDDQLTLHARFRSSAGLPAAISRV